MDLHFFEKRSCLAIVSRDALLFVRENSEFVYHHPLTQEFSEGIDCVSFDDTNGRVAVSSKRHVAVIPIPTEEAGNIKQISTTILLERNCSTLIWSPDGSSLVAGDKSGGIIRLPVSNDKAEPTLLASRVAVVLALCLYGSEGKQFLAVGDRDGRLSIFHYPATHNMHQVCLGHSQYIAAITVPDEKIPYHMMTLGGDGVVCLWNTLNGNRIARVALFDENSFIICQNRPRSLVLLKKTFDNETELQRTTWLVLGEDSAILHAFTLSFKDTLGEPCQFEIDVEPLSELFVDALPSDQPISAAACIRGSLVFVNGNAGKSLWPWKTTTLRCSESSPLAASLMDKLVSHVSNGKSEPAFLLRAPRLWLERHPHQHVAEYYAKRKKTKFSNGNKESADDPEALDSSSDDAVNV